MSREMYMNSVPAAKAKTTETRMAAMMTMALPVLMNCERSCSEKEGSAAMRNSAVATAAPSSPNTIDTVVEVGSPSVL